VETVIKVSGNKHAEDVKAEKAEKKAEAAEKEKEKRERGKEAASWTPSSTTPGATAAPTRRTSRWCAARGRSAFRPPRGAYASVQSACGATMRHC